MKVFLKHLRGAVHGPRTLAECGWVLVDAAVAFVVLVGLISFLGYVFKIEWMHDGWFPNSVDIAPQTALGLAILGGAMLTYHRKMDCECRNQDDE